MKKSIKALFFGLFIFVSAILPLEKIQAEISFGIDSWLVSTDDLKKKVGDLGDEVVKSLPLPVITGVTLANLADNFGQARSGGRKHEGVDIMAPMGSTIVSPTDAVVLKVGYGDSAGYYVYTGNPGGEIFSYMHLEKASHLKAGDEIEEGDLIGYVGNTGNAKGGSPHLHFEVRRNGPTDPFERITREFTVEQRVAFLTNIIDKVQGVSTTVAKATHTATAEADVVKDNAINLPNTDMKLGARGDGVKELQKFLIEQNVGTSVTKLAKAGATGYFGEVTQKALAEYQASVGIKPASGYYGPITRKIIAQNI